ncbi:MAG TPA: hypothetical protein VGE79_12130 [Niastella sp.]
MNNRSKTWFVNLFIVLILYGNTWGMLEVWQIRFDPQMFPQTPFVSNLFYIYGVFKEVHRQNRSYMALGSYCDTVTTRLGTGAGMIDLQIYDYYPQSHGEANQRLAFAGIANQEQRIKGEYKRMAALIKHNYNARHPEHPVKHVFILMYYWPADPNGYYTRIRESSFMLLGND